MTDAEMAEVGVAMALELGVAGESERLSAVEAAAAAAGIGRGGQLLQALAAAAAARADVPGAMALAEEVRRASESVGSMPWGVLPSG